jgi:hypothetical protein
MEVGIPEIRRSGEDGGDGHGEDLVYCLLMGEAVRSKVTIQVNNKTTNDDKTIILLLWSYEWQQGELWPASSP